MILNLYKNKGETPLEALNRLREKMPEYKDSVLSYAGRLDPMAEGVLLVLVDEENKNRAAYLNHDKEYTIQVLFGIETDTYDLLGKVVKVAPENKMQEFLSSKDKKDQINRALIKYSGMFFQKYPAYSSKTVDGKALFEHSREQDEEKSVSSLIIPKKEVIVYKNELISIKKISAKHLLNYIHETIALIKGDFRQKEILNLWDEHLSNSKESNTDNNSPKNKEFLLAEINISCSTGTYMRSIAHDLGKDLEIGALAFSIIRTRAGEFSIQDSIHLSP